MVLGRQTNFFLGKAKKKHLLGDHAAKVQNDGFLGFPKKKWFGQENQLFPRKKMVLGRKTNFYWKKMVLA